MGFALRWLGTACFEIRTDSGKTIVIDPYLDDAVSAPIRSDQIDACDVIFLTHGHYDHVLDVGKLVRRFNAMVYGSKEVCENLMHQQKIDPAFFHPVTAGDTVQWQGFAVDAVRGVHVDFIAEYHRLTGGNLLTDFGNDLKIAVQKALEASLGPVVLPEEFESWMAGYPGGEQLNYVFDLGKGSRIYMAGSYPHPELLDVARSTRADIMLLQVLPGKTLQGLEVQTAEFALASGAKIVVPQHHDPLLNGAQPSDLSKLKRLLIAHDVNFMELTPGKWQRFD